MQTPLEITSRGMSSSPSVDGAVRRWVERLERAHKIERCSVVIEQPHLRHRHGNVFHVHVTVAALGTEVVVSREPARDADHENVYNAIADAFRAARRQLTELRRRWEDRRVA